MLADIRSRKLHVSHDRIVRLSTFDRTSQGMMNLLGFIMSLVYMQAVHGWLSAYERLVNSQNFFSPYLTQEDLSCLGRTKSLSNAVIVCRIDDSGRFVTRGQCAHPHPRDGIDPIISSQSRYDHFDTAPYLSQHQHLGKRGELMGRTSKNIKLRIPEKPHKIKEFRSGSYRVATTISSQSSLTAY